MEANGRMRNPWPSSGGPCRRVMEGTEEGPGIEEPLLWCRRGLEWCCGCYAWQLDDGEWKGRGGRMTWSSLCLCGC